MFKFKNMFDGIKNLLDACVDNQFMYFTIEELTRSETAKRLHIDNTPTEKQKVYLRLLIFHVLDPLRDAYGKPITVNGAFRCEELNIAVGGTLNSHHRCNDGYAAADITVGSKKGNKELYQLIRTLNLPVCQCINENDYSWLHVSYNPKDVRREFFAMVDGKRV